MPLARLHRVGTLALLLCACSVYTSEAAPANTGSADTRTLPRVFLPIASELARSPIPVYVPTWLPAIPKSVYAGKIYPGFQTVKRQEGGPGYTLGLYTDAHVFDHAHRWFEIYERSGGLEVSAETQPVWLGKSGWAYLDSGTNAGVTISIVRGPNKAELWPPYTYELIYGCPKSGLPWQRYLACLKHVAASMQRYTPGR